MTTLSCVEARSMVSDYVDGDLAAPFARSLEDHLATCTRCPPLYASLVETLTDLRAVDDDHGIDDLAARVVAALDDYPLPEEDS